MNFTCMITDEIVRMELFKVSEILQENTGNQAWAQCSPWPGTPHGEKTEILELEFQ